MRVPNGLKSRRVRYRNIFVQQYNPKKIHCTRIGRTVQLGSQTFMNGRTNHTVSNCRTKQTIRDGQKFIGMKRQKERGKPHPASQLRMQHPTTELLDEQMINIVLDINWAIGNCQRHVALKWSLRGIVSQIWPRYRTMNCGPTMQASTNGQPAAAKKLSLAGRYASDVSSQRMNP
jgi:hypothetical protein